MRDRLHRCYTNTGSDRWLGWAFALFVAAVFNITIPMPLSRSGSLEVTLADPLLAMLWVILVGRLVGRKWTPSKTARALMLATVAFCAWLCVVTAVRLLRGDDTLQAFLVMRSTLLPLSGYLLIEARLETPRRALGGLVVFELALTLWHLGQWTNMRMSDFLGNSIVYAGLLVVLLPVNVYFASLQRPAAPRLLQWAAALNMLAALVFPVWTGSRGVSAVAFVVAVVSFVVVIRMRRLAIGMVAIGVVALLLQVSVWYVNPYGSAYGIYRLTPPPAALQVPMVLPGQAASDLVHHSVAVAQMRVSDTGREGLMRTSWEHIRADPLIGDGVVYFSAPGDPSAKLYPAHNFVLEHLNAYGAVGFLLYVVLLLLPIAPARKKWRTSGAPRRAAVLALLMTVGLLTFSLTQPTTMIMVIMVPFFLALAALVAPEQTPDPEL